MKKFELQYDLFKENDINYSEKNLIKDIFINKEIIKEWQKKIIHHQSPIFKSGYKDINQSSLFEPSSENLIEIFNPMELTPLPLSFWRWPKTMHKGPAVYFVTDKIIDSEENIILYIGETISAEKRWKGNHDCKKYISNYSDTLQKANIKTNLNIRFWLDVPIKTKERRKLEQQLIQAWLPPFNKETREIWATPFTSQIN
ncbi:GIY-YIG nuclease family protein [Prochlorococcus marinus]|uniref:GIY-YIG nuclease family protein n=1 Tax=Prochlorococcus marinus TaxID=1219 RepID=UPI0022B4D931|nr:GIY-YIG nuclease family protein [Prochlorococcus marinus]